MNYDEIKEIILNRIKDKGISGRQVSLDIVGNDGLIRTLKNNNKISADTMLRLLDYLGIEFKIGAPNIDNHDKDNIPQTVPLIGQAAAWSGESRIYDDVDLSHCKMVACPPDFKMRGLLAFSVMGDSMLPLLSDGDLIFVRRINEAPINFIGQICVVQLADYSVVVKTLRRGDLLNTFNLESLNCAYPTIINQQPKHVDKVLWVQKI